MIELRWVERSEPAMEFGENINRIVKVLQYRESVKEEYYGPVWSDWQDVPTVTEDKT